MANEKIKTILKNIGYTTVALGILAGVVLVQQNQDIREKAAPATSLYISPAQVSVYRGKSTDLSVKMDTSTNLVTGIDIDISFDPTSFEVTSMTKGSGIANLNNEIAARVKIDNVLGKVTYSAFTIDTAKAVNGSGLEVLKLTVNVKPNAATGSRNIGFDSTTAVAAVQENQNVVINKTPTSINIKKYADVSGDGLINMVDIGIIVDNYGSTPPSFADADINTDNIVNIVDIGIIVDNYGK